MMSTGELITVAEAAERFGLSKDTIYQWLARKLLNKYQRPINNFVLVDADEIRRKFEPKLVQTAEDEQQEETDA